MALVKLGTAMLLVIAGCAEGTGYVPAALPKELRVETVEHRHTVHFETDRSAIVPSEAKNLAAFLAGVDPRQRGGIVVEGHADARASDAYNLRLSGRRADTVAAFVRDRGFDEVEAYVVAFGERAPAAPNDTAEGLALNRRVEVTIQRYVAVPPECPDWSKQSGFDPYNLPMSNIGCATATNLAQMVADPADLVQGRSLGPADATREAEAIVRYRTDEVKQLRQEIQQ
jgi:pilus assembly protein CpaD